MRRGEENMKRIPQPAPVTADSPGREDQYGVIKAVLIVCSLLLGTSLRPLLFHISSGFRPSCEGIADSLKRFFFFANAGPKNASCCSTAGRIPI